MPQPQVTSLPARARPSPLQNPQNLQNLRLSLPIRRLLNLPRHLWRQLAMLASRATRSPKHLATQPQHPQRSPMLRMQTSQPPSHQAGPAAGQQVRRQRKQPRQRHNRIPPQRQAMHLVHQRQRSWRQFSRLLKPLPRPKPVHSAHLAARQLPVPRFQLTSPPAPMTASPATLAPAQLTVVVADPVGVAARAVQATRQSIRMTKILRRKAKTRALPTTTKQPMGMNPVREVLTVGVDVVALAMVKVLMVRTPATAARLFMSAPPVPRTIYEAALGWRVARTAAATDVRTTAVG